MDQQRIAVVGVGRWGKNLARNFHELGTLYALCDENPATIAECQQLYPEAEVTTDWREVLRDNVANAVAIATPAVTHYTLALAALSAGKHTFVEKPMALDQTEGEELVRLADEQERTLMVGHLLQYHPAVRALMRMVQKRELGDIQYLYSHRLNLGTVRRDENALWSLAPHDISVILALVGALPAHVSATGGAYLRPTVADVSVSYLTFANGARGHIFVSWLHPFKEQRLVVVGTNKMAVFDDTSTDAKLVVYEKGVEFSNGEFVVHHPQGAVIPVPDTEPLKEECNHFLECIRTGQQPRTDGREGLQVLRVLQACQTSLESDGALVTVGPAPAGVSHD